MSVLSSTSHLGHRFPFSSKHPQKKGLEHTRMDDYQDPEMDARMAEMMGFSAFATKPDAKKRKTSEDTAVAATSSNAIPLGENGAHSRSLTHNPVQAKQQSPSAMTGEHAKNAFPTGVPMDIFNRLTWKELEAYRKGVK